MIAEIQVLPTPPGAAAGQWSHVDAAIAAVAESGLTFETGPLGTTLEGPPTPSGRPFEQRTRRRSRAVHVRRSAS